MGFEDALSLDPTCQGSTLVTKKTRDLVQF